ncbi:hypothetical protein LU298_09570, partial [Komagataeibacter intermedius]
MKRFWTDTTGQHTRSDPTRKNMLAPGTLQARSPLLHYVPDFCPHERRHDLVPCLVGMGGV